MLHQDRGAYRLLLDLRADPARGNADGQTALHLAAMGKDEFWLDDLLERGVSPDLPNTVTGAPPLFDALRARLPENVDRLRWEEHTSELQSLMRTSYAVFCFKKKN